MWGRKQTQQDSLKDEATPRDRVSAPPGYRYWSPTPYLAFYVHLGVVHDLMHVLGVQALVGREPVGTPSILAGLSLKG